MTINFENSFKTLPKFLWEEVKPTPILNPKLIHITKLKNDLGINLSDEDLKLWLNGEKFLEGEQRIATRYAGHQFGVWAGQLGDGRAISMGEINTPNLGRQEIQTKGSGKTPFSRMGDGKAVIRSSVREYLASEAMAALSIPTTRVLALLTGDDKVYRETIEKSAIVARVFPSNLRFGHFEMCFHFKKTTELDALIHYAQSTFFPGMSMEEMLADIISKTAKLMAQWQGVGFCHGVMNSDNMSLLSLTLDYGPYGFLEDTDFNYICNHTDQQGRYAYGQQPSIGMWNLERLLICFMNHFPKEKLQELLNVYPQEFEKEYLKIARLKLGLELKQEQDYQLWANLLKVMDQLKLDYTYLFRQLSSYQKSNKESLQGIWDYYGNRQELIDWLKIYDERLNLESISDEERSLLMKTVNPKYVLKNYIAQEVIAEVEEGKDLKLNSWLNILYSPFEEHPDFHSYSGPTPSEHKHYEVSCSS